MTSREEEACEIYTFTGHYMDFLTPKRNLYSKVMRMFNAACERARINIAGRAQIKDMEKFTANNYDPLDDVVDVVPTFWLVTIEFLFEPAPGFWSRLSKAGEWKKPHKDY